MIVLSIERAWNGGAVDAGEVATVSIEPGAGSLLLHVDAPYHGDPPPASPPGPTEGLWEHEVIEAFLLGARDEYLEVELGPHGHHLVLRLSGRRRAVARALPLEYRARIDGGRWSGIALLPRAWLPPGLARVNAYAIHGTGIARRYLAAYPVPGERPDFHRLEAFGLLPPGALDAPAS